MSVSNEYNNIDSSSEEQVYCKKLQEIESALSIINDSFQCLKEKHIKLNNFYNSIMKSEPVQEEICKRVRYEISKYKTTNDSVNDELIHDDKIIKTEEEEKDEQSEDQCSIFEEKSKHINLISNDSNSMEYIENIFKVIKIDDTSDSNSKENLYDKMDMDIDDTDYDNTNEYDNTKNDFMEIEEEEEDSCYIIDKNIEENEPPKKIIKLELNEPNVYNNNNLNMTSEKKDNTINPVLDNKKHEDNLLSNPIEYMNKIDITPINSSKENNKPSEDKAEDEAEDEADEEEDEEEEDEEEEEDKYSEFTLKGVQYIADNETRNVYLKNQDESLGKLVGTLNENGKFIKF